MKPSEALRIAREEIELRWVWCDLSKDSPPVGSINIGDRLYQKLQYRTFTGVSIDNSQSNMYPIQSKNWTEWKDVPHSGEWK